MSNFLDDIADYMEDLSLGTVGATIFVGKVPAEPNDVVCVIGRDVGGNYPNANIPVMQYPRFQVFVRAANFGDGAAKLEAVRVLHGKVNIHLANYRVLRINAEQDGGPIGQDESGRSEFTINFIAQHHAT